jgi:hypothetical protein
MVKITNNAGRTVNYNMNRLTLVRNNSKSKSANNNKNSVARAVRINSKRTANGRSVSLKSLQGLSQKQIVAVLLLLSLPGAKGLAFLAALPAIGAGALAIGGSALAIFWSPVVQTHFTGQAVESLMNKVGSMTISTNVKNYTNIIVGVLAFFIFVNLMMSFLKFSKNRRVAKLNINRAKLNLNRAKLESNNRNRNRKQQLEVMRMQMDMMKAMLAQGQLNAEIAAGQRQALQALIGAQQTGVLQLPAIPAAVVPALTGAPSVMALPAPNARRRN